MGQSIQQHQRGLENLARCRLPGTDRDRRSLELHPDWDKLLGIVNVAALRRPNKAHLANRTYSASSAVTGKPWFTWTESSISAL
jgi:hypothetical protein